MPDFSGMWKDALDNGVENAKIDPDDGEYRVRVLNAGTDVTKNGSELGRVRFQLLDGDDAGAAFEHVMFFTSAFAIEQAARTLHLLGVAVREVSEFYELSDAMKAIVGTTARVRIAHDENNGKVFLRLDVLEATPPKRPKAAIASTDADDDTPF